MIRRIVIAAGALVAVASFSSCSSSSRNDVVAEVGGEQLTRSELAVLTADSSDGATVRNTITQWVQLGVIGGDTSDLTSSDVLEARMSTSLDELSAPYVAEAQASYDQGTNGAPALCLRAIPLAPGGVTPEAVLAEMQGGAAFEDMAAKYSTSPTLQQSGGILADANGNECFDPTSEPDLVTALSDAGAVVGTPVAVKVGTTDAVVLLRPFDELPSSVRSQFMSARIAVEVRALLAATDVHVNPRFGEWDKATAAVVPLAQG